MREQIDECLVQFGERLPLVQLGVGIDGRLGSDDVVQFGKWNQVGGDFVEIHVERSFEPRAARQVQNKIGDDVIHGVEGFRR